MLALERDKVRQGRSDNLRISFSSSNECASRGCWVKLVTPRRQSLVEIEAGIRKFSGYSCSVIIFIGTEIAREKPLLPSDLLR